MNWIQKKTLNLKAMELGIKNDVHTKNIQSKISGTELSFLKDIRSRETFQRS